MNLSDFLQDSSASVAVAKLFFGLLVIAFVLYINRDLKQ